METKQNLQSQPSQEKNSGLIPYNLDGNVFMPDKTQYVGVMIRDWKRLRNFLSQCKQEENHKYSNIAYTLFGVAGSSLLSIITTFAAKPFGNKDTVVAIILCLILMVTSGVGFLCLYFQSCETKHSKVSIQNVENEMNSIEEAAHIKE